MPSGKARRGRTPAKKVRKKKGRATAPATVSRQDRAAGAWFAKLVALQERLLAPNGCPWDREQTHQSLRKYLIEETYEALDAMDSGDAGKFAGELGDVLLQVVFHSALSAEAGGFDVSDVIESIFTKMVRRHPHVFGEGQAHDAAAVLKNWEQIKAEERAAEKGAKSSSGGNGEGANESLLSGVSKSLPGVLEAYQLTRRAAHIGFDWEDLQGVFDKLDEERREIEDAVDEKRKTGASAKSHRADLLEQEVGDLLFAGVNVARFLGVDPEIALKKANRKFKQRFRWMESEALRNGSRFADLPRERMEELWNESKAALVAGSAHAG
jgi:MazG family protein